MSVTMCVLTKYENPPKEYVIGLEEIKIGKIWYKQKKIYVEKILNPIHFYLVPYTIRRYARIYFYLY